jgi:hypothetical protein
MGLPSAAGRRSTILSCSDRSRATRLSLFRRGWRHSFFPSLLQFAHLPPVWYVSDHAAVSCQFGGRCIGLEFCCTTGSGADNNHACTVLSPKREAPLHVGSVRHGRSRQSTACVSGASHSLPLLFAGRNRDRGCTFRSFNDNLALLSK